MEPVSAPRRGRLFALNSLGWAAQKFFSPSAPSGPPPAVGYHHQHLPNPGEAPGSLNGRGAGRRPPALVALALLLASHGPAVPPPARIQLRFCRRLGWAKMCLKSSPAPGFSPAWPGSYAEEGGRGEKAGGVARTEPASLSGPVGPALRGFARRRPEEQWMRYCSKASISDPLLPRLGSGSGPAGVVRTSKPRM